MLPTILAFAGLDAAPAPSCPYAAGPMGGLTLEQNRTIFNSWWTLAFLAAGSGLAIYYLSRDLKGR